MDDTYYLKVLAALHGLHNNQGDRIDDSLEASCVQNDQTLSQPQGNTEEEEIHALASSTTLLQHLLQESEDPLKETSDVTSKGTLRNTTIEPKTTKKKVSVLKKRLDTTNTTQAEKKVKTNSGAIHKPSAQKLTFDVGIVPENFPKKKLETKDIKTVVIDVLKLICDHKGLLIKPLFRQEVTHKIGWMIFHCANEMTANWLKSQKMWSERNLKAIDKDQFPQEHVLVGNLNHSAELETNLIMGVIEGQNKGIATSFWKTLNRRNEGHVAIITVEVDNSTFDILKRQKFVVHYAFGQKVEWKPANEEPPEMANSSMTTTNPVPGTSRGYSKTSLIDLTQPDQPK